MNIPIDAITVPPNRRPLRNLEPLADSIRDQGLINPITVTEERRLVAGYHRLEACRKLGFQIVPVRVMSLDEVDAELVEIDENLVRNECSLVEHARLSERRRVLYVAKYPQTQHGGDRKSEQAISSRKNCDLIPRFASDMATKTGVSERTVHNRLAIAKMAPEVLDKIEDTPVANKQNELLALAKLDEDTQHRVADKIVAGATSVRQVLLEDAREKIAAESRQLPHPARIVHQPAAEFLQDLDPESVDLLVTDPPYSTDVDDIRAFAAEWVPLALSRVKRTGRAYICTGAYPHELQAYLDVLLAQDTYTLANVLVWTYQNTIGPKPRNDYKLNWQAIFYLRGPEAPPLDCPIMTEQFAVQPINAPDGRLGNRYHAWQKPDELAERLVRHSTRSGDLVVDPFAGTGAFLLAAARLGRTAIGCEINDDNLAIALKRGCISES